MVTYTMNESQRPATKYYNIGELANWQTEPVMYRCHLDMIIHPWEKEEKGLREPGMETAMCQHAGKSTASKQMFELQKKKLSIV